MKQFYTSLLCLLMSSSLMAQVCTEIRTPQDLPISDIEFFIETLEPGQTSGSVTPAPMIGNCLDLTALPPVQSGGQYRFIPSKTDGPRSGVSTLDLVLSTRHLLGIDTLQPYAQIAADVDASLEIDIYDLSLVQRVILYVDTNFPTDSWRFIDANFPFSDLSQGFPGYILIDPINPPASLHFVGIKTADITGSRMPFASTSTQTDEKLVFKVQDREISAGEIVAIDFLAQGFTDLLGFQFTFDFDETALEFQEQTYKAIPPDFFTIGTNETLVEQGLLTACWIDGEQDVKISDNQSLFSIQFKALQSGKLSDWLKASSGFTKNKAYSYALQQEMEVYLDFGLSTGLTTENTLGKTQVFQNQPNPLYTTAHIPVQLQQAGRLQLTITNAAGQIVQSIDRQYPAGLQLIPLYRDDFGAAGIYFYNLQGEDFRVTKKLVVH